MLVWFALDKKAPIIRQGHKVPRENPRKETSCPVSMLREKIENQTTPIFFGRTFRFQEKPME